MPAPNVTKAAIQRAIEATQAAGLSPSAVTVRKDGSVRVETVPFVTKGIDPVDDAGDGTPNGDGNESLHIGRPPAAMLHPKNWVTK
ncbi:hypothetical protein [Aestuariivita sp.]|jgi:hypothetical protein|uniref:hypothetical protein n=1 Tax=Aestuariivita sp. TaxID=1872407 RepID=UPI0021739E07|nr:hypothetical protein [Aestuariivita sp.]MCE8006425.1 hypothetical protein [Aestuariivita sp.]